MGGERSLFDELIRTAPELVSNRDFLRTQTLALGSSPHPTTPSQSSFGMAVAKLKLYSTWDEKGGLISLIISEHDSLGYIYRPYSQSERRRCILEQAGG